MKKSNKAKVRQVDDKQEVKVEDLPINEEQQEDVKGGVSNGALANKGIINW